jgi:uncharacterized protein YndB with AHSA1/START domain
MSDVRLERVYAHPPERVWRALTDPQALAEWLMPNDFQPRVGHKFQFRAAPRGGWRGIVDCEVLEVDPPRRLSYLWQGDPKDRPTVVTWILEPTPEGTRLRLEHTGFRGLGGLFHKLLLGSGWKRMLRTSLPTVLDWFAQHGEIPIPAGVAKRHC